MKTINFVVFTVMAVISLAALIVAILTRSFQLGIISFITGAVSYLAYQDFVNPE